MAKYASIDIGSNTILLLVVDDASGALVTCVDECAFGRLSQGLATSNRLHPDAIERSLKIIDRYRELLSHHAIERIACVGTQALRESENRAEFVAPAEAMLSAPIEIIAGEREAQLVAKAVSQSFPELCQEQVVIVDVGGASTEFIVVEQGAVRSAISVPIGAVRLTERFLKSDPPSQDELSQMTTAIDAALVQLELPQGVVVIGTAGTATSIASIELGLPSYQPQRIHGLELSAVQVQKTLERLVEMPLAKKRMLDGLEAERADIVTGGVAIYSRVLAHLDSQRFIVSDRGVRWGLAYELASP